MRTEETLPPTRSLEDGAFLLAASLRARPLLVRDIPSINADIRHTAQPQTATSWARAASVSLYSFFYFLCFPSSKYLL